MQFSMNFKEVGGRTPILHSLFLFYFHFFILKRIGKKYKKEEEIEERNNIFNLYHKLNLYLKINYVTLFNLFSNITNKKIH